MPLLSLFSARFLFLLSCSVPFWQSTALSPSSSPLIAQKIAIPGVSNAGKVSDSLFRGAQPHLSDLVELKKIGVTTIVDLRAESRQLRDREQQQAEALGIHFVSLPVGGFSNPTSAQLAEFFELLRSSPSQKIFVHCEFGEDRTGVFIAAYRIAFDRWSADQAVTEMIAFGFNRPWHSSMESFVRSLPDTLRSDPVLKSALAY
jgi:tyrosine-protein phosphatase SIW14